MDYFPPFPIESYPAVLITGRANYHVAAGAAFIFAIVHWVVRKQPLLPHPKQLTRRLVRDLYDAWPQGTPLLSWRAL